MVVSTWKFRWAFLRPTGAGVLEQGDGEAAETVSLFLRRVGGLERYSELPILGGVNRGHVVRQGGLNPLNHLHAPSTLIPVL